MIDPADTGGLALAALALTTALIAADVRRGRLSIAELRVVIADAHTLVHDPAGFVVDGETTQAADDFLSVAEAFADPTLIGIPEGIRLEHRAAKALVG
jgi:hypothetical protein